MDRDQVRDLPDGERITAMCDGLRSEVTRLRAEGVAVSAIGEIGLDFHYSPQTSAAQFDLFRAQLRLAADLKVPVIVHSRDADEATVTELATYANVCAGEARLACCIASQAVRSLPKGSSRWDSISAFSGILTFAMPTHFGVWRKQSE